MKPFGPVKEFWWIHNSVVFLDGDSLRQTEEF